MFEGLPPPQPTDVRQEVVTSLSTMRELKRKVLAGQKGVSAAETAALKDTYSRGATHNAYSQSSAWSTFLKEKSSGLVYLPIIIVMLLVFPTNSAGVERVFSATNWLKNERRNRMLDDLLNANLHVKLNSSEIDYSVL